jgi:hypothetical protein
VRHALYLAVHMIASSKGYAHHLRSGWLLHLPGPVTMCVLPCAVLCCAVMCCDVLCPAARMISMASCGMWSCWQWEAWRSAKPCRAAACS